MNHTGEREVIQKGKSEKKALRNLQYGKIDPLLDSLGLKPGKGLESLWEEKVTWRHETLKVAPG